jgi:hypothetical protein
MNRTVPTVLPRARNLPLRLAILTSAAALSLTACRKDEVTHVRVPKGSTAPEPQAAPPGMQGDVAPPPRPAEGGLKWTLPKGWGESATPGGMRYATLTAPVQGKVDVSVVVLPGPAGGELPNVNRWRNQISLPPVDEAGLAKARQVVKTKAGAVSVYDFTNDAAAKSRMIAGLLASADGNTWFVKMSGDAKPVGEARKDFLKLLETLRFD